MTQTKNLILAAMSLSTMLFSCSKKDNSSSTISTGPYSSVQDVFSSLAVHPKSVTLDASAGGDVFGNSGTRYTFYGGSFMTASGTTVVGKIDIKVAEYLKKGDMLFSKILPISNGEPLISGGEVNVEVSQGGQPVYLKPFYRFEANIPTFGTAPTGMQLFTGQPVLDTSIVKTNWVLAKRDSQAYSTGIFVVTGKDTLLIVSDSLTLCNADAFMTSPNFQSFTVSVSASGKTLPSTVYGYALYDQYKGVWPLYNYSNGTFTENHVPNIPVHLAVFTIIDGNFYGGTLGVTPSTGSTYHVTLTQQNAADFKAQLNDL